MADERPNYQTTVKNTPLSILAACAVEELERMEEAREAAREAARERKADEAGAMALLMWVLEG